MPKPIKPPKITERQIRNRVGERSFQRGWGYFKEGRIFDARRQGKTLKAHCLGNSEDRYSVEVTLDGSKVVSGSCSCPVGDGGYCKHVAALLLTWRAKPVNFVAVEDVHEHLKKRTKEELLDLIENLLIHDPELKTLIELQQANSGSLTASTKASTIQRRVENVFRSAGYGWDADNVVCAALNRIVQIGNDLVRRKEYVAAAGVFRGLLAGFINEYDNFEDETGNVVEVANDGIAALAQCLGKIGEPTERKPLIGILADVCRYDIDTGCIGLGDDIPRIFARRCTPDEKKDLSKWLRKHVPKERDFSSDFARRIYGTMILELEKHSLDEAACIRLCREFGLIDTLVARLIKAKRFDEAGAEAARASIHDIPMLADVFVRNGLTGQAEQLVCKARDKIKNPHDTQLYALDRWLYEFYVQHKNWEKLLAITTSRFKLAPSIESFRESKKYAVKLKQWERVKPRLIDIAKSTKDAEETLIRIYLDEKLFDEALAVLGARKRKSLSGRYYGGALLEIEVADAIAKARPEAALALYLQEAELRIASRDTGGYTIACNHLKKARAIYTSLGKKSEWQQCIAGIRSENARLPALQRALTKARL